MAGFLSLSVQFKETDFKLLFSASCCAGTERASVSMLWLLFPKRKQWTHDGVVTIVTSHACTPAQHSLGVRWMASNE